jgi:hypothetical protein
MAMENRMTAVEWLENILHDFIHPEHGAELFPHVEKAKAMEREQHGETWDAALIAVDRRGGVILRALPDFYDYWEKRNTPDSEGVDQTGLPQEGN